MMKPVPRITLYPILVSPFLFFTAFAMVRVNWWAPLFMDRKGNLPPSLKFFQTFDA